MTQRDILSVPGSQIALEMKPQAQNGGPETSCPQSFMQLSELGTHFCILKHSLLGTLQDMRLSQLKRW